MIRSGLGCLWDFFLSSFLFLCFMKHEKWINRQDCVPANRKLNENKTRKKVLLYPPIDHQAIGDFQFSSSKIFPLSSSKTTT